MAKFSLAGWKDPKRRPRYIIWTGVTILVLAAVMVVALGATSSYWFCANACHKVQDDTITAYNLSTHNKINCMACHMPVNANPAIFLLHKMEALGELYMTVTGNYEEPLNAESKVSLEMKSANCTQCHSKNRKITPSNGIVINHEAHEKKEVNCTICHNRIAHNDNFSPRKNVDPKTGKTHPHNDNMKMQGCFRCHSQEANAKAPGECAACHTPDFDLLPKSHEDSATWFPKGHAEAAREAYAESQEAKAEDAKKGEGEAKGEEPKLIAEMPSYKAVFYCGTCHKEQFCTDCHGMQMPHPAEFKEPKAKGDPAGHPVIAQTKFAKCEMCHQPKKTQFCAECHHGKKVGWEFKKNVPWEQQHGGAVAKSGVKSCTASCHEVKFCVACHTKKKAFPSSHKAKGWTLPTGITVSVGGQPGTAKPSAKHPAAYAASPETCEVCHGTGGPSAAFCKSCHKTAIPHEDGFKKQHVASRKNPAACQTCHRFKEICSNCHHIGASYTKPWIQVHGLSVAKNGPEGCVAKCHKKDLCVKCHTARKVKPATHLGKTFTRDFSATKAVHVQLYTKDAQICTYCHGDGGPSSRFCTNCHKLPMPHPATFGPAKGEKPTRDNGGDHQKLFAEKKVSKAVCANCHQTTFCNNCHHSTTSSVPWLKQHPGLVKKGGATQCFDCHVETFCSHCHVRLGK
jgi:nitrate/TMAO reductase-like tetraheme cytochrome c subunit